MKRILIWVSDRITLRREFEELLHFLKKERDKEAKKEAEDDR